MLFSIRQRKYFAVMKRRSLCCPFYYTERIFRRYQTAKSMLLSITQREYFAVILSLCSFLLYRENISQLLNCEVYPPFHYTERAFRSYWIAKFILLSIIQRGYFAAVK